jgi:hypothetical protein
MRRAALAVLVLLLLTGPALAIDIKRNVHPGIPNPSGLAHLSGGLYYGTGVITCAATAPMIFNAVMRREPTLGEAWSMFGNCVLPVVGGFIVRSLWRPEWDLLPTETVHYDPSIRSQR